MATIYPKKEELEMAGFWRTFRSITARKSAATRVVVATAVLLGALTLGGVQADEGMWMVQSLDKAPFKTWQGRGLELDDKEIYNTKGTDVCDAVIRLGGGTATFVSPEGLIVTNHHVAFGALQRSSSVKTDYIQDGFLAETRSDEIQALGLDAYVLEDTKDVTKKVLGATKKEMTPKERYDAIEKVNKELVAKVEKGKDLRAEVRETYDGAQYFLYTYFRIKDVRIVYAPPGPIGVYGGEIDNWMWPRHTGDFSFLRAYVAPDGQSASYSEDNVPYQPRKYLAFSTSPLKEGDFTMVIGYPGRTSRYRSSYSIDYVVNKYYPFAIKMREDLIAILDEESAKDRDSAIKIASTVRGLENGYKNNQGMLEGLLKYDLLDAKLAEEAALVEYMAANPDMKEKYGDILGQIAKLYEEYPTYAQQYTLMRYMSYYVGAMSSARTIYKWSIEQEKKDIDRDQGYMARDEENLRRRLGLADLRYDEDADKRVMAYFIGRLAGLPEGQRPDAIQAISGDLEGEALDEAITKFVDKMYAGTKIPNKEERLNMFGMSKKDLTALGDPVIDFVARLEPDREHNQERYEAFDGAVNMLRPQLMELRASHSGEALYPDANRTMRVSVGEVKGYSPRDAVTYDYITTLGGMVEKATGEDPFNAPAKLIELSKSKDYGNYKDPKTGDVPVCFLSTDDVTGGNSGSAVLNGKGEIIGLVFDGNYEAISADYQFIPALTRTIHVDSRYILFIMEKFSGAGKLLEELTVYPQVSHM
jgi:hypothetical protein